MRIWLSIRVELIQGGGRALWPRPGRVFAAARSHTFLQLGDAIDTAFARWDRAHLSLFELADATDVCGPIKWKGQPLRRTSLCSEPPREAQTHRGRGTSIWRTT